MSSVFTEGRLELTFDERWSPIVYWDGHPAYRSGVHALGTTRAMDFCGIFHGGRQQRGLYLIELTDFRGHDIASKASRLGKGGLTCKECGGFKPHLYDEVALKARDTIAGLVAAARRRETEPEIWRNGFGEMMSRLDIPIHVVLWVEEDMPPSPADESLRIDRLKKSLRWLTTQVLVADRRRPPPGVSVRQLPASSSGR